MNVVRLGAALAVLVIGSPSRAAEAEPQLENTTQETDPAARPRVHVTCIGVPVSALERALGPGLQSSYVLAFSSASQFAPDELFAAPADSPTDIHVWVNATTQGIARLYFVNRDGTRYLVRTLEVSQTIDEMDSESLAQVIEWSLQALVDGNAGITRAEAKSLLREASPPEPLAVLPPTTESAPPSSRWRPVTSGWLPELALLHGWTMLSAELPAAQGPVLRFGFDRLDPHRQLGIALSGQYQFPQRHADLGVALQLQSMAWRLDARYLATGLIDGAAIGLRVGPGFDVVFSSAEALDYDRFDAVQNKVSTVPLVTGGIVFQLRAENRVRLELSLGIEVDLIHVHYDVMTSSGAVELVSRWPARPAASIGVELF